MALSSGAMVPTLRHYTPPWNPKSGRSLTRTNTPSPAIIFALTRGSTTNVGNSNSDPHRRAVGASSSSLSSTTTPTSAVAPALRCRRSGRRPLASSVSLEQQREFFLGNKQRKLRKAGTRFVRRYDQSVGVQFDCKIAARTRPEVVSLDDVPHLSQWVPDLPRYPNPLGDNEAYKAVRQYFVEEDDIVAKDVVVKMDAPLSTVYFRRAGPRETVCFTGDEVRACIVTCGGLCPGLNTVIREIVCGLWRDYGVRDIFGIEGGYQGFYSNNTIALDPIIVNDIHKRGGTILGTSRGGHDKTKIVASIIDRGFNQVYIIGGDGTQRGAAVIHEELMKLGMKVVVVGIPKTVDNDIAVIDKSFGFDTAVEEAQRAINAAHVEAESVKNGIGLVKLMGRYSGSIAVYATLASRDVDCCLIPEVPFYMEGEGGLYEFARARLKENGHMVIVVAEGADHELLISESSQLSLSHDASGNRLLLDVGLWLGQKLRDHFAAEKEGVILKYIDPTYMVRAVTSNASDNVYCTLLAHSAMHGAMAGYTGFTVGPVNDCHALIPIATVAETKNVNVTDRMWARLLSFTQQPDFLRHGPKKEKNLLTEAREALKGISTDGTGLQNEKGNGVIQPQQIINEVLKGAPQ